MTTGKMTETERKYYESLINQVHLPSKFRFLSVHKGLRPGCLHVLLGTSGSGKSTLVRSIILDTIKRLGEFDNVLVWLSEETVIDFKLGLIKSSIPIQYLQKIEIVSEQQCEPSRLFFQEKVKEIEPEAIFFDNLMTSHFYMDRPPFEQADFAKWIKKQAEEFEIPIMLVCHTNAEIHDNMSRLVNQNDIRGSKSIVNLSQYLYIFQRFTVKDIHYAFLKVDKHRYHQIDEDFSTFPIIKNLMNTSLISLCLGKNLRQFTNKGMYFDRFNKWRFIRSFTRDER